MKPTGRLVLSSTPRRRLLWVILFFPIALAEMSFAAPQPDSSGDDLFTNNVGLRRLSIEISRTGLETLRHYQRRRGREVQEREDVPATVREGDTVWTNVAIHLKGAAGSFRPIDDKPALTLNFDKFAEGQRFHGLQKISLNNSVQDPTFLHEKLCREIYVAAGVPVPRADYAMVELNGQALGLYVLLEGWNKQFLKRYFTDVRGNLYDGGFSRDINTADLPVNSGKNPEDHTALQAVVAACAIKDPPARLARLETLVDLDRFYTLLALDAMLWNWDGYSFNRNNYRAFHDRASGRFVFMPHGLDQMFWKSDGPIVTGTKGIVARAVLQSPAGRRQVLQRVAELRTQVFKVEAITERLNQFAERNRPGVAESGFGTAVRQSAEVKVLRDRIAERAASIDEQLARARALLSFEPGQSIALTNWLPQVETGTPALTRTAGHPAALHIDATNENCSAAWMTTVWLEEGTYRVTARIKTERLAAATKEGRAGASVQIWSRRKDRDGVNWEWFPYRESRSLGTRGEIPCLTPVPALTGTTDWTDLTYEFELRQPYADLDLRCRMSGQGKAWFDLASLKISRVSSEVSSSRLPRR